MVRSRRGQQRNRDSRVGWAGVHAQNYEQKVLTDKDVFCSNDAHQLTAMVYAAREYSLMSPCRRSIRTTSPALGIGNGSGGLSSRLR